MDIRISGHQVDTGAALRSHVESRLEAIADKYFSRAQSAQATFGKGPHDHGFVADIVMHVMHGVVLKASGRASDAHPAFDEAADRVETQLRRYKRRLKDRSGQSGNGAAELAEDNARYTVFDEAPDAPEPGDHPAIIAETRVDIPEASLTDAVMMLDLRNTNALMFRNVASGEYNMVYRRGDGTIGWVEPARPS